MHTCVYARCQKHGGRGLCNAPSGGNIMYYNMNTKMNITVRHYNINTKINTTIMYYTIHINMEYNVPLALRTILYNIMYYNIILS